MRIEINFRSQRGSDTQGVIQRKGLSLPDATTSDPVPAELHAMVDARRQILSFPPRIRNV